MKDIGFRELSDEGRVEQSKLSNILDTATTIITADGYAAYRQRSDRVDAVPGDLTSAVAENINRWLDETSGQQGKHERVSQTRSLEDRPDHDYEPRNFPSPVTAVIRGIDEEISEDLSACLHPQDVRLTGIAFDMEAGHPDALFMVLLDMTKEALEERCRSFPGIDSREGRLFFLPVDIRHEHTQQILDQENRVAGGKASLVRSLEIFKAYERKGYSFKVAFDRLRNGDV